MWPLRDLWLQQCITLWSGILRTKFDSHREYLSNLTSGWPKLTPAWPLTPVMHYTLFRGSSCQSGSHRALLSNFTSGWPQVTLNDLWSQWCITLWSGVLPTKFGSHRAFLKQLDLCMTSDLWWGHFETMPSKLGADSLSPCQVLAQYLEAWRNT